MSWVHDAIEFALAHPQSTPLCNIFTAEGSDKARPGKHSYAVVYRALLSRFVTRPGLRIFELGIGTNDPTLPSSMGVNGVPGASLRTWKRWFPHAQVLGADIDAKILFQENRIATFHVDQTNATSINSMWTLIKDPVDVIIDDGLHAFYANDIFLCASKHMLKPGGLYIVEDISEPDAKQFENTNYGDEFDYVRMLRLPIPGNTYDNNLLILHKRIP